MRCATICVVTWGGNRDLFWCGYKVPISETCTDAQSHSPASDPDAQALPNIATTDASVPDAAMTTRVHDSMARRGLLPDEHLLDSGCPSADLLGASAARYGVSPVTPMLADVTPQARAGGGFDAGAFHVDFDTQQVIRPQGRTSAS